jgi:hypothetical protein
MGNLPAATVRTYLAQPGEIPAALSDARGCGLGPDWDEADLVLRVPLLGPAAPGPGEAPVEVADTTDEMWTEPYLLEGIFDDYRTLPPIWRFLDPRTGDDIGPAAYPAPRGPSVLHPQGLVCAHFSRLAYADHGGPHGNWGGSQAWQTPVEGTQALTISAMLARLIWEVRYNSRGRIAPLPPCAAAA